MYSKLAEKFARSMPDWLYAFVATFYWILHPHREAVLFISRNSSWLLMRKDGSKLALPKSRPKSQPVPYERYFRANPSEVVLDVGACIGEFAIPAAKRAKEVIAVEANPENVRWLRYNIALNNLKNIHIVEKAAWDCRKILKLYIDEKNIGGHSIVIKKSGESVEVQADTLDDIVSELEARKIDFIKMDVEGSELKSLNGAKNLLKKCKKIVIEPHISGERATTPRACRILKTYFDVCFVSGDGKRELVYARKSDVKT